MFVRGGRSEKLKDVIVIPTWNDSSPYIFRFSKMGKFPIPKGWKRLRDGNRVVYESDPSRVKIHKIADFDKLKANGRFDNVHRQELNFSIKMENQADNDVSDQSLPDSEPMDITLPATSPPPCLPPASLPPTSLPPASQPPMDIALPVMSPPASLVPVLEQMEIGVGDTHQQNHGAISRQRSLVDKSVQLLTKDTSSPLDHSQKLKEASARLNNLRTESDKSEINFEEMKQAVNDCDTAR